MRRRPATPALAPRLGRLVLLLSLGGSGACTNPLAPADVAGTYVLRQVGPDPLPTVLYANSDVIVRVLADTLRLVATGEGTEVGLREVEFRQAGIPPGGPQPVATAFHFRIVGGRIEITFGCPPNGDCAAGPHLILRRTSAGIRADVAPGLRVPLYFARVGDDN
jgi:hypothetical protein